MILSPEMVLPLQVSSLVASINNGVVFISVERSPPATTGMVYRVNRRRVCRNTFRIHYPVSESTLSRLEREKRLDAVEAYATRKRKAQEKSCLRGDTCVAWLLMYAAQTSELIPDVELRLLPCRKLIDMWREYARDQKERGPDAPKPVEVARFRDLFHHHPFLANIKISNSKCNFGRCTICRQGEAANRKAAKSTDTADLIKSRHERQQHLQGIRLEKVSYYFEREMARSPVGLKITLIIDKVIGFPPPALRLSPASPAALLLSHLPS